MSEPVKYDFSQALAELDNGVFNAKLSRAIMEVASGTIAHGAKGQVVITLDMKRIGESRQIAMEHTLKYIKPTLRGHAGEQDKTATVLHVNASGSVTLMPDTQGRFIFSDKENA